MDITPPIKVRAIKSPIIKVLNISFDYEDPKTTHYSIADTIKQSIKKRALTFSRKDRVAHYSKHSKLAKRELKEQSDFFITFWDNINKHIEKVKSFSTQSNSFHNSLSRRNNMTGNVKVSLNIENFLDRLKVKKDQGALFKNIKEIISYKQQNEKTTKKPIVNKTRKAKSVEKYLPRVKRLIVGKELIGRNKRTLSHYNDFKDIPKINLKQLILHKRKERLKLPVHEQESMSMKEQKRLVINLRMRLVNK